MVVRRIVSGGQTGVDRAALDVAILLEIEHGGWCPLGRLSEDGCIPPQYNLRELPSRDYAARTEQNVIDSDGTLILHQGLVQGGTQLTYRMARKHRRPVLSVDLSSAADEQIRQWLVEHNIAVLNVAGPRESSAPGIGRLAEQFLARVLAQDADSPAGKSPSKRS